MMGDTIHYNSSLTMRRRHGKRISEEGPQRSIRNGIRILGSDNIVNETRWIFHRKERPNNDNRYARRYPICPLSSGGGKGTAVISARVGFHCRIRGAINSPRRYLAMQTLWLRLHELGEKRYGKTRTTQPFSGQKETGQYSLPSGSTQ